MSTSTNSDSNKIFYLQVGWQLTALSYCAFRISKNKLFSIKKRDAIRREIATQMNG